MVPLSDESNSQGSRYHQKSGDYAVHASAHTGAGREENTTTEAEGIGYAREFTVEESYRRDPEAQWASPDRG